MNNLVDNPVINTAFAEPTRHFLITRNQAPQLLDGRRPAQYIMARRARKGGGAEVLHESVELELVNRIRERVQAWREAGYPGVTRVTRELLEYWQAPDRDRRFFFCQIEAAETIIFFSEGPDKDKVGIEVPKEHSASDLPRMCCKMATGSGKTIIMAMLIAWQILNKVQARGDALFSDSVLIVCPNLTVRDRLRGSEATQSGREPERPLIPNAKGNYFEKFDVVPPHLRPLLAQGRVMVTNWHVFSLQDDAKKRGVVNRGAESNEAFCKRVLKELDLSRKTSNLFVINDEAHHAYRFYPEEKGVEAQAELFGEDFESDYTKKDEEERARVWIEGLDRIHKVRGIRRVLDLSATPYFLKTAGPGKVEGEPFPWIVSDFGLLDAIECGIVKVPNVPTWDNAGRLEPRYKNLYEKIKGSLPRSEKELTEDYAVLEEVQDALETLGTQWHQTKEQWEGIGRDVPPVMIVVCSNTAVSALLADYLSGEGKYVRTAGHSIPELRNNGEQYTLRIDTELLRKADIRKTNQSQDEAAKELREIVATVGKRGEKGEKIRCVVSVGMLSEGWDANNVTQILGLRAFSSPLLCEQVIGRGLRRYNYDVDPDGYFPPEFCDVYGIPFEVLPIAKGTAAATEQRDITVVKTLSERTREHEVLFPRVISYVSDVKYRIRVDVDSLAPVVVTSEQAPTLVGVCNVMDQDSTPAIFQDRREFYENNRVQSAMFAIAARITANFKNRMLFPQVLQAVQEYWQKKVRYDGRIDEREACLERYISLITSNIMSGIKSEEGGEDKFLPVLDPYRPMGSTNGIFFQTSLHCVKTRRSHLSHIACHSRVWERDIAVKIEKHPAVLTYARNYKLGYAIPYFLSGKTLRYEPDFIVRLRHQSGEIFHLVLEVKGEEDNIARLKANAAMKWKDAVNNWGKLGRWEYVMVGDLSSLEEVIDAYVSAPKMAGSELNNKHYGLPS
jgi:type III restriction enzyme